VIHEAIYFGWIFKIVILISAVAFINKKNETPFALVRVFTNQYTPASKVSVREDTHRGVGKRHYINP
jgi:hypothetical protein